MCKYCAILLIISEQTNTQSWTDIYRYMYTVQITFIFIDFRVCDFAFAFKTQNAPCVSRFRRVLFRQISICVLNANETFV